MVVMVVVALFVCVFASYIPSADEGGFAPTGTQTKAFELLTAYVRTYRIATYVRHVRRTYGFATDCEMNRLL